jgi:hypothetical protein
MNLFKVFAGAVLASCLIFSTPAGAFTDEAIKLVKEWVIQNGEKIARKVFNVAIAKAVAINKEFKDLEGENDKIDSFCAPGSKDGEGCKDWFTGGTTIRSCGGTLCDKDTVAAITIESACGLLSRRNPLKIAEFETSACAHNAWGKIRGDKDGTLAHVVGGKNWNVESIAEYKKEILLGILSVREPGLVAQASDWDEGKINVKLQGLLKYDNWALITHAVILKNQIKNENEMKEVRTHPRAFAQKVAAEAAPLKAAPGLGNAVKGRPAGNRDIVIVPKAPAKGAPKKPLPLPPR